MKKVVVIALDYDGVADYIVASKNKSELELVKLIKQILLKAAEENAKVILLIGSSRQSNLLDISNATHNKNGLAKDELPKICDYFSEMVENVDLSFDSFRISDLKNAEEAEYPFVSKIDLVLLHLHHIYNKHQADTLEYILIDDRGPFPNEYYTEIGNKLSKNGWGCVSYKKENDFLTTTHTELYKLKELNLFPPTNCSVRLISYDNVEELDKECLHEIETISSNSGYSIPLSTIITTKKLIHNIIFDNLADYCSDKKIIDVAKNNPIHRKLLINMMLLSTHKKEIHSFKGNLAQYFYDTFLFYKLFKECEQEDAQCYFEQECQALLVRHAKKIQASILEFIATEEEIISQSKNGTSKSDNGTEGSLYLLRNIKQRFLDIPFQDNKNHLDQFSTALKDLYEWIKVETKRTSSILSTLRIKQSPWDRYYATISKFIADETCIHSGLKNIIKKYSVKPKQVGSNHISAPVNSKRFSTFVKPEELSCEIAKGLIEMKIDELKTFDFDEELKNQLINELLIRIRDEVLNNGSLPIKEKFKIFDSLVSEKIQTIHSYDTGAQRVQTSLIQYYRSVFTLKISIADIDQLAQRENNQAQSEKLKEAACA